MPSHDPYTAQPLPLLLLCTDPFAPAVAPAADPALTAPLFADDLPLPSPLCTPPTHLDASPVSAATTTTTPTTTNAEDDDGDPSSSLGLSPSRLSHPLLLHQHPPQTTDLPNTMCDALRHPLPLSLPLPLPQNNLPHFCDPSHSSCATSSTLLQQHLYFPTLPLPKLGNQLQLPTPTLSLPPPPPPPLPPPTRDLDAFLALEELLRLPMPLPSPPQLLSDQGLNPPPTTPTTTATTADLLRDDLDLDLDRGSDGSDDDEEDRGIEVDVHREVERDDTGDGHRDSDGDIRGDGDGDGDGYGYRCGDGGDGYGNIGRDRNEDGDGDPNFGADRDGDGYGTGKAGTGTAEDGGDDKFGIPSDPATTASLLSGFEHAVPSATDTDTDSGTDVETASPAAAAVATAALVAQIDPLHSSLKRQRNVAVAASAMHAPAVQMQGSLQADWVGATLPASTVLQAAPHAAPPSLESGTLMSHSGGGITHAAKRLKKLEDVERPPLLPKPEKLLMQQHQQQQQRLHPPSSLPSRFCHICTRSAKPADLVRCANLRRGMCRKVICRRCIRDIDWDWGLLPDMRTWTCTHCRQDCPTKAQCHTYKRVNKNRKSEGRRSKKDSTNTPNKTADSANSLTNLT